MNYSNLYFILLLLTARANAANDSAVCDNDVTDIKQNDIDLNSFCDSKSCIIKCCGENEVIYLNHTISCKNVEDVKKELSGDFSKIHFDYSDLKIYKDDAVSTKKFRDFKWLHSKTFARLDSCASRVKDMKLLEEGVMVSNKANQWSDPISVLRFCVDLMVGMDKGTPRSTYVYRVKPNDEANSSIKTYFIAISMLISAFFLLLVLVVYCILHQLRNIQGMLLTAYVATLMCTYTLKASYLLFDDAEKRSHKSFSSDCTVISEITYFLILASFFWLKLMSFDIWWTFRGTRKLREIHRRGINVKFMIYASYAYGAPAAMTLFAALMDATDLPPNVVKPFFMNCLISSSMFVYLYVPLIILTCCNCLLFLMTMYNIWLIGRNMKNFDKSTVQKNKKNQSTFLLYTKLSLLMGVAWILELVQSRLPDDAVPVWLYILINSYNMFTGVIIFFMFVFKTNIFVMLCKRFNIENRWTRRHCNVNSSTRSELSKSSKNYSRTRSTDSDVEEGIALQKNEGVALKRVEGSKLNGRFNVEFSDSVPVGI